MPPSRPSRFPEPRRSRKTWVVAVAATVATLLIAGGIALAIGSGSDDSGTSPSAANVTRCTAVRQQFQNWLKADYDAGEAQLTATQDWLSWANSLTYLPSADSPNFTAEVDRFNAAVAAAQAKQQAANSTRDAYQIALPQCTVSMLPQACQTDFSQHQGLVDLANRHDAAVDAAVNAIRTQQEAIRAGDTAAANAASTPYNAAASEHNTASTLFATASTAHDAAVASCDSALGTT